MLHSADKSVLPILIAVILLPPTCLAQEAAKSSEDRHVLLEGAWQAHSFQIGEETIGSEHLSSVRLVVNDDKWTLSVGTTANAARLTAEPEQRPMHLNIVVRDHFSSMPRERIVPCIYSIVSDTLTLYCPYHAEPPPYAKSVVERPAEPMVGPGICKSVWVRRDKRKSSATTAAPPSLPHDALVKCLMAHGVDRFAAEGQLLALTPERIPEQLPALIREADRAGLDLAGKAHGFRVYLPGLVRPSGRRSFPTLIALASGADTGIQSAAKLALESLVDDVRPDLTDVLSSGKPEERRLAAEMLGTASQAGPSKSLKVLAGVFADDDVNVRVQAAISALALAPDNAAAVNVLTSDYESRPDDILRSATRAQASAARPLLETIVNDQSNDERRVLAALHLAAQFDQLSADAVQALMDGTRHAGAYEFPESDYLATKCIAELARRPELRDQSVPHLIALANESDSVKTASEASWALIQIDPSHVERCLPMLVVSLTRDSRYVSKWQLLAIIGGRGSAAAFAEESILTIVRRKGGRDRIAAALALLQVSSRHSEDAVNAIHEAIHTKRFAPPAALRYFDDVGVAGQPVADTLLEFVAAGDIRQRQQAVMVLGIIGSGAKEALPHLNQRLEGHDVQNSKERELLLQAIERIELASREDK